jgi:orotidine-5'-phosphate decarboxylase
MNGTERVIFALDVPDADEALKWVERLNGRVGAFKVGLELFTSAGPELVRRMVGDGVKVFLDLKFHDIPNTVAGAVTAASKLGVWMLNVHATAGAEAMKHAMDAACSATLDGSLAQRPLMIAVTVLTSSDKKELDEIGVANTPAEQVVNLAKLTKLSGMDGVVASPLEAAKIKAFWPKATIITPGIRPAGARRGDQKRIATPAAAIRAGADYLVVGRPIRGADDPEKAAEEIALEVTEALAALEKG